MSKLKAINDVEIISEDKEFTYQEPLTKNLDQLNSDFNQEIINEIVLWKVNRYAELDKEAFNLLNQIDKNSASLNIDLTKNILHKLLAKESKGIRLAMASTILRFKNPNIYQIIDQRVYRMIYGTELKLPYSFSLESIKAQSEIYTEYLKDLRSACIYKKIEFSNADRILYNVDKRINKSIPLKNYGNIKKRGGKHETKILIKIKIQNCNRVSCKTVLLE